MEWSSKYLRQGERRFVLWFSSCSSYTFATPGNMIKLIIMVMKTECWGGLNEERKELREIEA